MSVFDWIDALPNVQFVGLVIVLYGLMGVLLTLLDEWERRR